MGKFPTREELVSKYGEKIVSEAESSRNFAKGMIQANIVLSNNAKDKNTFTTTGALAAMIAENSICILRMLLALDEKIDSLNKQ